MAEVRFEWLTGLRRPLFRNLRLVGSWDGGGRYANVWLNIPMQPFIAEDGCPAWGADVILDDSQIGTTFFWGVIADAAQRLNSWAITTEVPDPHSCALQCSFVLKGGQQRQRYYLTHCRRFGANKRIVSGAQPGDADAITFSVFAPNAQKVELVTGDPKSGYIFSDGIGVQKTFAMSKGDDGIWQTDPVPELADFNAWDHTLYMFRITRDDGSIKYRTDLFARCQIGGGRKDPESADNAKDPWDGTRQDVKGTKSCSVAINPERVTELLNEGVFPETRWLSEEAFWANEFDSIRPVRNNLENLIIYELHVEGLFTGDDRPATFAHAIALLDHLVDLGVNAVELLPTAATGGWTWGYGTSHYFATEYAGGGRDQLKHFVRACHQRGIAVLIDVVYNHYDFDAERAEWMYDTTAHEKNFYLWYQGHPTDWPQPEGGYLDNGSSGRSPNFASEYVRRMFASSAASLVSEFHIDGFRVDLTQAMHRDNAVHANGHACPEANLLGTKALREWVRTLRLIKPTVILVAEDHTGWRAITQPQETGGIGFDAVWWVEWYHNLIGDSQNNAANARLVYTAGFGDNGPLAMTRMSEVVRGTPARVIANETHDQAGNATYKVDGATFASARTLQVAVNGYLGGNRAWAEARCRVAAGLTLLTPGVPMFFMGEEVGACEPYRYNDWLWHRENFLALRQTSGGKLFDFYRDLIRLRRDSDALRSANLAIVHVHDGNRVIAFRRWIGERDYLVVASFNNAPFANGYQLSSPDIIDGGWIEILNSDSALYGGGEVTNPGTLLAAGGHLTVTLAANTVAVLQRL